MAAWIAAWWRDSVATESVLREIAAHSFGGAAAAIARMPRRSANWSSPSALASSGKRDAMVFAVLPDNSTPRAASRNKRRSFSVSGIAQR